MFIKITTFLCAMQMVAERYQCLKLIDLPSDGKHSSTKIVKDVNVTGIETNIHGSYPPVRTIKRRFMPRSLKQKLEKMDRASPEKGDDQDDYLKQKISMLIDQTIQDVKKKLVAVEKLKGELRENPEYKAGFILSMVRKSRVMLNDLFNLAVKHRNNWKALQQLKVFEYIVHTNVDTTNLVRQLVEVHIQHLNATSTQSDKKRVVLL